MNNKKLSTFDSNITIRIITILSKQGIARFVHENIVSDRAGLINCDHWRFQLRDDFADEVLTSGESVRLPLRICLPQIKPFLLIVDVLGNVQSEGRTRFWRHRLGP